MVLERIIVGNWKNWEKYQKKAEVWVDRERIWNYEQNVPDLIVDDIIEFWYKEGFDIYREEEIRNFLYSVLLKRGVNKWLFVRKLLIRYKKLLVEQIHEEEKKMKEAKKRKDWKEYYYHKGRLSVLGEVRKDLKLLCCTPRWVIWNGKDVGIIDFAGMRESWARKWLDLYHKLKEIKFKK